MCLFILFMFFTAFLADAGTKAEDIVSGTVTFTTSRSVYVQCNVCDSIEGDKAISAGLSPDAMHMVTIRSLSSRKIVLEREPSLTGAVRGATVYLAVAGTTADAQTSAAPDDNSLSESSNSSAIPSIPYNGRVSAQYYRYRGGNGSTEYDQPSLYMDMRVGGEPSFPVALRLRLRTRMQRELVSPGGDGAREERTDRLYDLSFSYGGRDEASYIGIGRMRTVGMSGMGGLDGLVYERDIGNGYRAGVFYGVAPELDTFIGDRSDVKRGGFIRWENRPEYLIKYSATAAYIGRKTESSRTEHLLFIGHNLKAGKTVSVIQEAVLNTNTGGTGRNAKTLRNIRSYIRYAPLHFITVSGSYYAYFVREYRDLDNDFDPVEDLRYVRNHTFRPSVTVTLPGNRRMSGDILVGENNRDEIDILSGAFHYIEPDIFSSGITGSLSVIATRNNYTDGRHLLLHFSRRIMSGMMLNLSGSGALYDSPHQTLSSAQRLRTGVYHSIGRLYHYSLQYTRVWGKYQMSNQFFLEGGVRFSSGK